MARAILVTGATGKQGSAVIRALLSNESFIPSEYTIYAVTRNVNSPSAKALATTSSSIKLVHGDLSKPGDIFSHLSGKVWGLYALTNPGKNEEQQGKALIDAAVKAGVRHMVLSSADRGRANDGNNKTFVPHMMAKHEIEIHLRKVVESDQGKLTYTILRPVFFYDNIPAGFLGKVISTGWRDHMGRNPTKAMQLIDSTDIGVFGARAFLNWEDKEFKNQAVTLAADRLTFEQANGIFMEKTGGQIPTTNGLLVSFLLWMVPDAGLMFKWLRETDDEGVDIDALKRRVDLTDFANWAERWKAVSKST